MVSTYDVVLDGDGYMVKAGTYERRQEAIEEAVSGRVRLFDFYGGTRRAAQLERDRFWRGLGAWPTFDSQGLAAGPKRQNKTETTGVAFDPSKRSFSFVYKEMTYLVNGRLFAKVTVSGGNYNGLQQLQQLTADAVAVAQVAKYVYFGHGSGTNWSVWDLEAGTYSTTWANAKPVDFFAPLANGVVYEDLSAAIASGPVVRWALVGDNPPASGANLDAEVLGLAPFEGGVWAITRNTIWKLTVAGSTLSATAVTSAPRAGFADDFTWFFGHNGVLYAWLSREVHQYDSADDIFVPIGLRGQSTVGACGVGRWVMVGITDEITGLVELWAWDGRGWWQLDESTGSTDKYQYPVPIFGAADDADLLAGRGTTTQQTAVWQLYPRSGKPGLRDSYTVITSLFDAGERDTEKAWRRVAVELAWPDSRGSADSVMVAVSYSINGGYTWTALNSANIAGNGARTYTVAGDLAASARSNWLQVKVEVTSILDWAPVVVGVWCEFQAIDGAARRRKWKFAIQCKDAVVLRDGTVDTAGARVLANRLWSAWDGGGVVTFRDVDYDLTVVEYTARIVGIRELIPKPQDAGGFANGLVELVLVEV